MKFLDPLEAEKFKKQNCVQFCWTPCKIHFWSKLLILTNFRGYLVPFDPYLPPLAPCNLGRVQACPPTKPQLSFQTSYEIKFRHGVESSIPGNKNFLFQSHKSSVFFWILSL